MNQGEATSDVSDANPAYGCAELSWRHFGGVRSFSGPVRTLRCRDDTALLQQVVASPGAGAVLVVDGEASLHCALLGDRHGQAALDNGWRGFVINGAVRDCGGLRGLSLGVVALGSVPRRSGKSGAGDVDAVVSIGGVDFEPGGYVWVDEDGVVVRPAAEKEPETS